jgi:hypothetical protein
MLSVLNPCFISAKLMTPQNVFLFFVFFSSILFSFLIYRFVRDRSLRWYFKVPFALFITPIFVLIILFFWFLVINDDDPPSNDYHPYNALIKNRCITHPDKYCPKNEKEAIASAPPEVGEKLKTASITYVYYPKTRDYTLVVRNWNYHHNNDRAVIFDSRLKSLKNYGRNGQDFFDANIVDNCDGTFRIVNPPPLSGPWKRVK